MYLKRLKGSGLVKDLISKVVDIDNLYGAWEDVRKNKGAPGGDLVTLERFRRRLELNLLHLAESVETGRYHPGKVRMVTILTGSKWRQIAVWCVADRVLQRACLRVMEPFFEPMFLPSSYGYRPGRSVADAVRQAIKLREEGYVWVVDADIRDCFGSLDHAFIMSQVRRRIHDQDLLDLIEVWLPFGRPRQLRRAAQPIGISLGSVISPILCNIYLHVLDRTLKRFRLRSIRYADDFIVLCESRDERNEALRVIEAELKAIQLELNCEKTDLTDFEHGFSFLGVTFKESKYWYEIKGIQVTSGDSGESFPLDFYWY